MICGGGTSSGGGPNPGGLLGIRSVRSSQSPPRFRMLKVPFSPTLRAAAAAPAGASRDDRLCRLDARLAQPASQRQWPRRVQAVVPPGLPWVHAPVVAVGEEGGPGELSGRQGEGHSVVALVGGLEGGRRVQLGVGHGSLADGLRRIGVVIQVEVAGSVDARLAVGQIQVQGLTLLDVAEDLAEGGLHAEAVASALFHLLTASPRRPGSRSCFYLRPRPAPSCERPAAPPAHNAAGVSAG